MLTCILNYQIWRITRASAQSNFSASLWWVIDIFDDFSQKSRKLFIFILLGKESFLPFLAPKSHFRWLGVPQTLTLPFKLEDIGSNFGGSLDGGWKGSSIRENMEKIQQEMGEI